MGGSAGLQPGEMTAFITGALAPVMLAGAEGRFSCSPWSPD